MTHVVERAQSNDRSSPEAPNGGGVETRARERRRRGWLAIIGLLVWFAIIAIAKVWGEHVIAVGDTLRLSAPPLTGAYRRHIDAGMIPAVLVGLGAIVVLPRAASRLSWTRLLVVVGAFSVAFALALAVLRGWGGITDPLLPGQYIRTVPGVGNPLEFLSQFTGRLAEYNIHTQGHPPGMVLVLWVMDRVGFGGVAWNAVAVMAGGAASTAAVLVAVRDVAGETHARRAAPFVAMAPAVIWWSSGDAFFAGVSAWAVALVILATGQEGRRSDVMAVAGGLLFGVTAFLSYGLVLLAVVPLVVAWQRRRLRPIMAAGLGAAGVFVVFLAAGFWWFSGLGATRERYFAGVGGRRPYGYFVFGNIGAFALALGPAVAVALMWLRDRRVWLLVGGGLLVMILADVSGMSKAEVERIWLPFVPWVLLATTALGAGALCRLGARRIWLALQIATGLAIEMAVRSPW